MLLVDLVGVGVFLTGSMSRTLQQATPVLVSSPVVVRD
ncbi:hypothetical protein PR002_g26310 [Phytophthora rubi]|uniref:Uncharacterized protein n=1 Tax=Phytophthora rubi TaxID=129364 RepID=A0A6A3HR13_9STRA|nr:hypothetical protein PR002_g26310 [Phytophthora rubi]